MARLQRSLGGETLCAAIGSGNSSAGPIPGQNGPGPFSEVTPGDILKALPNNEGALKSCNTDGFELKGNQIHAQLLLTYPASRYIVDLNYLTTPSLSLKSFSVRLRPSPDEEVHPPFTGYFGYKLPYASHYKVSSKITGRSLTRAEAVYFNSPGAENPAPQEAHSVASGTIRLDVIRSHDIDGKEMSLEELKVATIRTLTKTGQTYLLRDVKLHKPAFLADISAPRKMIKLLIKGNNAIYMFLGKEETPLLALARNLREYDLSETDSSPAFPSWHDTNCAAQDMQLFFHYLSQDQDPKKLDFPSSCHPGKNSVRMPAWLQEAMPAMLTRVALTDPDEGQASEAAVWQTPISILYEFCSKLSEAEDPLTLTPNFADLNQRFSLSADLVAKAGLGRSFGGRGASIESALSDLSLDLDEVAQAAARGDRKQVRLNAAEIVKSSRELFEQLFSPPPEEPDKAALQP